MRARSATLDDVADRGGADGDAAFAVRRHWLGGIPLNGRLADASDDGGFHDFLLWEVPSYVYNAHIWRPPMPSNKSVQNTHISEQLRALHGALLDIVGIMNRPQRDEVLIREAGIPLDR